MSINSRKQAKNQLLRIGQLAKETGVAISALRYYEEIGLIIPATKSQSKYRYYNQSDIILVNFVKKSQNLGFNLEEIAEILDERKKGKSPCPKVRKIADKKISELKGKIQELENLEKAIIEYITECKAELDCDPGAQNICHMIDKVKL